MSNYHGGSHTSTYHHVILGHGERSDFTHLNIKDKGDFVHNYTKMGCIEQDLVNDRKKCSSKCGTFGANYDRYDKTMVHGMKSHYLGKGQRNTNGLGP